MLSWRYFSFLYSCDENENKVCVSYLVGRLWVLGIFVIL